MSRLCRQLVCHGALLAAWPLWVARAGFTPRPLTDYLESQPEDGSLPGVRRFSHNARRVLRDGSRMELNWDVHADPESILSVDAEHANGVRVLRCDQESLALRVPEELAQKAQAWRHVTAGDHLHGCSHLMGSNLYHRVLRIERTSPPVEGSRVVELATEELSGIHEVFPDCKFYFKMVPPGKEDDDQADDPRDLSSRLNEDGVSHRDGEEASRRLFEWGTRPGVLVNAHNHMEPAEDNGASSSVEDMHIPHEVSSFAWNWNYLANSTRSPRIRYKFPGGESFVELHRPYFKANCSVILNFTSHIHGLAQAPHVTLVGELDGFFDINLDIATLMDFENDDSFGVIDDIYQHLHDVHAPIAGLPNMTLPNLDQIRPLNFFIGGVKVTLKPGFHSKLKAYHRGLLQGTLTVALSTKLNLKGLMRFDTEDGLYTNMTAAAENVSITPPTWMLFTQAFELGMMLDNEIYLAGGLIDNPMRASVSVRPYFNISIKQQGANMAGFLPLAAFPFRLVGAPQGKCYSIMLSANGHNATTSCQLSTGPSASGGMVEYADNPEDFQMGMISQEDLLTNGIFVTVLEDGVTPVASGTAICELVVNGECHHAPVTLGLNWGTGALLEMGVMHHEDALPLLQSKIKSVSLRFPTVTLERSALSAATQESLASPGAAAGTVLQLQLERNGRVYDVPLTVNGSQVEGQVIYDLGPMYLDAWEFPGVFGNAPKDFYDSKPGLKERLDALMVPTLNLTAVTSNSQAILLGTGLLPPVAWDQAAIADIANVAQEIFESLRVVPLEVPLYDPSPTPERKLIATVKLEIYVQPPSKSAFWIFPAQALGVSSQQGPHTFYWTVQTTDEAREYVFQGEPTLIRNDGNLQQMNPPNSFTTSPLTCSTNTGLAVQHYMEDVPPCIFQYPITLPDQAAGVYMVMLIKYLDAGDRSHYSLSAPFKVQSSLHEDAVGQERRRLLEVEHLGYDHQDGLHPLHSTDFQNSNSHVAQTLRNIQKRCSPEPLKYGISGGISLVESVDNLMLPSSMGDMGASAEPTSEWTQSLFQIGNGTHQLKHLLPRSICSGGVCEGMQPGCRKTRVTPMHLKEIEYKLSRFFRLQDHMTPKMRSAVAYGLALVPSAVEVSVEASHNAEANAAAASGALGGRRLRSTWKEEEVGDEYNRFVVRFVDPGQYELTQDLLEDLNRRNAFRFIDDGREKELGPIRVESMVLRDRGMANSASRDIVEDFEAPDDVPAVAQTKARGRRSGLHVLVWSTAGAAGALLFVAGALRVRRSVFGGRCTYMCLAQPAGQEDISAIFT